MFGVTKILFRELESFICDHKVLIITAFQVLPPLLQKPCTFLCKAFLIKTKERMMSPIEFGTV